MNGKIAKERVKTFINLYKDFKELVKLVQEYIKNSTI